MSVKGCNSPLWVQCTHIHVSGGVYEPINVSLKRNCVLAQIESVTLLKCFICSINILLKITIVSVKRSIDENNYTKVRKSTKSEFVANDLPQCNVILG